MQEVWVVEYVSDIGDVWSEFIIERIFSTREAAEAYVATKKGWEPELEKIGVGTSPMYISQWHVHRDVELPDLLEQEKKEVLDQE